MLRNKEKWQVSRLLEIYWLTKTMTLLKDIFPCKILFPGVLRSRNTGREHQTLKSCGLSHLLFWLDIQNSKRDHSLNSRLQMGDINLWTKVADWKYFIKLIYHTSTHSFNLTTEHIHSIQPFTQLNGIFHWNYFASHNFILPPPPLPQNKEEENAGK